MGSGHHPTQLFEAEFRILKVNRGMTICANRAKVRYWIDSVPSATFGKGLKVMHVNEAVRNWSISLTEIEPANDARGAMIHHTHLSGSRAPHKSVAQESTYRPLVQHIQPSRRGTGVFDVDIRYFKATRSFLLPLDPFDRATICITEIES